MVKYVKIAQIYLIAYSVQVLQIALNVIALIMWLMDNVQHVNQDAILVIILVLV
jgi:hypothetical protein